MDCVGRFVNWMFAWSKCDLICSFYTMHQGRHNIKFAAHEMFNSLSTTSLLLVLHKVELASMKTL